MKYRYLLVIFFLSVALLVKIQKIETLEYQNEELQKSVVPQTRYTQSKCQCR